MFLENTIGALITLFFLFLLSPLKDELPEPLGTQDNFSYYFSLELASQLEDSKNNSSSMIDDFTSIIIRPKKSPIDIESINIRGIEEVKRCVVVTRDEQDNVALLKAKCTLDATKEMVTISNIGSINKYYTLSANIWGSSSTDVLPLIRLKDGSVVWPEENRLVDGRLLFLSDYWRLIITLVVLVMLGYYYILKSRIQVKH